jgi:hypothetical protein
MTLSDFHIEFKVALDKLDSSAYPDILPEEIDLFLNEAQERFIKTRYGINNLYKEGFEEIQKRTDDLRTLVVTNYAPVSAVTTETNTYKADFSTLYSDEAQTTNVTATESYQFYLRGRSRVVKTGCTSTYTSVNLVRQGELEKIILDPFNSPKLNSPVAYFERGIIYLVTDGSFTIDRFKITYIKRARKIQYGSIYPTPIADVTCELPDHTHKELVQIAVNIALETIESRRLNTQEGQLNKIE